MDLAGRRHLPIGRDAAWQALNDPAILREAIPGCEEIERVGENEYSVVLFASLGPVRAQFRGRLAVEDIVAPESYTLRFEGEGAAAGFARGVARVRLEDDDTNIPSGSGPLGTRMEYEVRSQVGGKLAQVGNRLIDSAARKLAEEFFAAFEARALSAIMPAACGSNPES